MIRTALLIFCMLAFSASAITPGAQQTTQYLSQLRDQQVALVVNHTARVNDVHLLDVLLDADIDVASVMSPEHGFRGDAAAGEKVADGVDSKTGLPVHSLYGSTKKPTPAMLEGIDVIVFDIQDVGTRFYTYLSTLHYVLEAAAEHDIEVVLLDRPNPHISTVDGPVLDPAYRSFVGMHPIPVLHGMTLGELALMIEGEGWIANADTLRLTVIPVAGYARDMRYVLPVAPSPNLPNELAVALYPTLCFFEGTAVSVGRGTDSPFQLIGHATVPLGNERVLVTGNDAAPSPKLKGQTLQAARYAMPVKPGINLDRLLSAYQQFEQAQHPFFSRPDFFDKLAGTDALRKAIQAGQDSDTIRASWQDPLTRFKAQRAPYLIYPQRAEHDERTDI